MDIIPAIDTIEGKCVRLTQGDYARLEVYADDPVDVAKRYEDAGIRRLHLVDLEGAKAGRVINYRVLERIAVRTVLQIDFGGGVQSDEDVRIAFESGAAQITVGSIAVREPEILRAWLQARGADRIIVCVDNRDGKIAIDGWRTQTETSVDDFIETWQAEGVMEYVCTDIARDGALEGPAVDLYKELVSRFPKIQLIASGGVSGIGDVESCAEAGVAGVIIGKALYHGRIQLEELKPFLPN